VNGPGALRVSLALAAAAAALVAALAPSPHADSGLALDVRTVPLDPRDPSRQSVGQLRYRGGLWLRSEDPRFGGLSGLRVSETGHRLVAISDCGNAFIARLRYDEGGALAGIENARLFPLLAPGSRPLPRDEVDAEDLFSDGVGLGVSFEGRHHLWRYPAAPPLEGAPTPLPAPPGLAACGSNQGVEAAARLLDGQLLLISEGPSSAKTAMAWVGSGESWRTLTWPLFFAEDAPGPFHPTGAALLPGGDVLVVERRFPPLAARVRRIGREALTRNDLVGTEVARILPPLTLDNLEGIDVVRGPHDETLVYFVSDDNDCAKRGAIRRGLQRTLLLMFELVP
jgi:hypothetical protein